ncbi:hypothetical protein T03_15116 [Trichinella britovi]|uniref:Uncharacterized protein n=1 Tax=Trichinella britovi TaxID=45882 RepID=A0A0V1C4P3_TRIBR|nr:hypothetical protein T03_15116 [Trichinella britovi]
MPSAFLPFSLPPDYSYNQFLSQAADLPKHSLAKVEETTLHPGVGNVALNCRDQGCFKIAHKFCRFKLNS